MTDTPPNPEPPPETPPKEEPPPADPPPQQSVSIEEHQKLLDKLKAAEEERNSLKQNAKESELQQMKDQERWKEIAALKEKEANDANERTENMGRALQQRERMSAIRTAALQAGIRKDALDDLDLFEYPELKIETTSLGNINIIGAQTAIEALKMRKPYLFSKRSGNINASLPEVVDGGRITIDHIMKAEDKFRKSGSADDKAAYIKITQQYKQQQRGS